MSKFKVCGRYVIDFNLEVEAEDASAAREKIYEMSAEELDSRCEDSEIEFYEVRKK